MTPFRHCDRCAPPEPPPAPPAERSLGQRLLDVLLDPGSWQPGLVHDLLAARRRRP